MASSVSGEKLVAATWEGAGRIYRSTNWGKTWELDESSPARSWQFVASSADGTTLVAGSSFNGDQPIYVSIDGIDGGAWKAAPQSPVGQWFSGALSADGTGLTAVGAEGLFYSATLSKTDATWTQSGPGSTTLNWYGVASSEDGKKVVAAQYGGQIYTWDQSIGEWADHGSPTTFWYAVTSSSDGQMLAAVTADDHIYTSNNGGATWKQRASERFWYSVASSADGSKLVATNHGGFIYTSTSTTTPGDTGSISGGPAGAITLKYLGNGVFDVVSHEGELKVQ